MMRFKYLFCLLSLVVAINTAAFAESKKGITEISLYDPPAYEESPIQKILLLADGSAILLTGTKAKPLRSYGSLNTQKFAQLARWIESEKFFSMEDEYFVEDLEGLTPDEPFGPTTSVARNGVRKSVHDCMFDPPGNIWGVELAIRGFASQIKWSKPVADKPR